MTTTSNRCVCGHGPSRHFHPTGSSTYCAVCPCGEWQTPPVQTPYMRQLEAQIAAIDRADKALRRAVGILLVENGRDTAAMYGRTRYARLPYSTSEGLARAIDAINHTITWASHDRRRAENLLAELQAEQCAT